MPKRPTAQGLLAVVDVICRDTDECIYIHTMYDNCMFFGVFVCMYVNGATMTMPLWKSFSRSSGSMLKPIKVVVVVVSDIGW